MGILPTKSSSVLDPLLARGFVLLSSDKPIVVVAVDWCEIRNQSYDAWRDALADAAHTDRSRVLVSSNHQHNAPVVDRGAQRLLDSVGLQDELYSEAFHGDCLDRLRKAVEHSIANPKPVTHIGLGQAKVEQVAFNRRVIEADGVARYHRGSASGGSTLYAQAEEGDIDPYLKTISFWNNDEPVLAYHSYATHPMSYYGDGAVTADFPGIARRLIATEHPDVTTIYAAGCSGDVTAGKYNDGSQQMRATLADRLFHAMQAAWADTQRHPLQRAALHSVPLTLSFRTGEAYTREHLTGVLHNNDAVLSQRILAAMALSSLNRVEAQSPIDLTAIDFGPAQIVVFPGETFVGYQLAAQKLRPDSFLLCVGYGECWPGYIPTARAWKENFTDSWLWVSSDSATVLEAAMEQLLTATRD